MLYLHMIYVIGMISPRRPRHRPRRCACGCRPGLGAAPCRRAPPSNASPAVSKGNTPCAVDEYQSITVSN